LICVHFRQFYEKLIYPFRTAPKSSSKNDEVEKREERDQGNNEEEQERCTERVRDEDRILLASRDGQYFYTYDGSYLISRKMNGLISFRTEIGQGLQSLDVHPLTGIVLGVENTTSLGNSLIMLDYHGFLRRRLVNTPLIHGLCVSPDGKYIFATDKNWKMALLDPTLNTVVEKNLPPYSCGSFFGAEFSHDSSSLLAAVGGICLYSVPSLELLWRRKAPGEITGIAWLADGKRFAITTRNGHLVIYSSSGNVLGKWVLEGNGIEGLASFKGTRNIIAVTTQDGYYYGLEVPTQSL
ncbi:MAG: WD40 repeat domain-containing protein, partial [Thermoplasmata archaeon]